MRPATVAVLVTAVLILSASTPASAGKLRFYVDRNNSGFYDANAGEEVAAGTAVYYQMFYFNATFGSTTAPGGTIDLTNAHCGDKVWCRYLIYSQPVAKADTYHAGFSMFDLYATTYSVGGGGEMRLRGLTTSEASTVNGGGTVDIRLGHPIFSWNLVAALNWDADWTQLDQLKSCFEQVTNYLFDVTDGQMKIGKVRIWNNVLETSDLWQNCCDVRFSTWSPDWHWPHALPDGVSKPTSGQVYMPQLYNGQDTTSGNPDTTRYSRTVTHELGHYLLWFYDEYKAGMGDQAAWTTYRSSHHKEVPANYGFMDHEASISEMSSNNDYLPNYAGKLATQMTDQIWNFQVCTSGPHRPCWQHLCDRFDNASGAQTNWNGYGGARMALSMPTDGIYLGLVGGLFESRSSSDRDGPVNYFPLCFGGSTEVWPACSVGYYRPLAAARAADAVIDLHEEPKPAGSSDPRVLIDAGLAAQPGNNQLRIRLICDQQLLFPPSSVAIRLGYGDPIPVQPIVQVGPATYQGAVSLGRHVLGAIDVTAVGMAGTTQTSAQFEVQPLSAAQRPIIFGPHGECEVCLPNGVLASDTLCVSLRSGNAAMLPADQSLQLVGAPVSFQLQDGATVPPVCTINSTFTPGQLAGRDANTLVLMRFDEFGAMWIPVMQASSTPGYRVISASEVEPGIYAAFARPSPDLTPPGTISNLTAQTGSGGRAVLLSWTAPGDDGSSGQAARYCVWFSNKPISSGDLSGCTELPMHSVPQPAGWTEQYAFEMPEADTRYYFVIQAQDEAENLGQPSNCANAVSYVEDSDGDGLPDSWETAYGMDPTLPGDESLDPDEDGLTNIEEYLNRTDPLDRDSDGDGLSDGLEVAASTSPINRADPLVVTASSAKSQKDGTKVGCPALVSTIVLDENVGYAQEWDRSAGIRLEGAALSESMLIEVIGTVATTTGGELYLSGCVFRAKELAEAGPLGMSNRSIGGGACGRQQGIAGASGLSNIGLLVRTCGRITRTDIDYYYVDDGAGLWDGTYTSGERNIGIKVRCDPGAYVEGDYIVVTGVSSCWRTDAGIVRQIHVRPPT